MTDEHRKLAAIVFTDMVGYTALSQRDEARALRLLKVHNELVRSVLTRHRGREVKTIGDAFLLEFDSALDATLWAIEIQQELHEHNLKAAISDKIDVRIGIHAGDVVYNGADVLGDAVNVASRIEFFADSNGICLTESVFLQVRNKIPHPLVKLAEQKVKNVELPMDLYKVVLEWASDPLPKSQMHDLKSRIAVLPFENISPDPNDSYFADGLTEEMITVLSQIKGLRVIAKTSVSRFKGTDKGVSQIGSELRVGSILEGSVRKVANKIRVTVQLIDATSEEHVWVNQYDRDLSDIFHMQSDIAKSVSEELRVTLAPAEEKRVERQETGNAIAHVAYLKGRTLLHERTEQAIRGAQEQFELAIKHDPHYARAYAGLADIYIILGDHRFAPISECREKSRTFVNRALQLDPDLPEAHVSLASIYTEDYRFADAEEEFKQTIALVPSYSLAHHWYTLLLGELGRTNEGFREALLAEELDPLSPVINAIVFMGNLALGNEEEILKNVERIRELESDNPFALNCLLSYHLFKSEHEQALACCSKLKQLSLDSPVNSPDPYVAYIYAVTGRRGEAIKILNKLQSEIPKVGSVPCYEIAIIYVGLNDLDGCFKWLEKAFENHERFFVHFRYAPILEKARKDPRFNDLLRRAQLPPVN